MDEERARKLGFWPRSGLVLGFLVLLVWSELNRVTRAADHQTNAGEAVNGVGGDGGGSFPTSTPPVNVMGLCNAEEVPSYLLLRFTNDTSNMVCRPLWNSFVLRYVHTADNVLTIVLSAEYTSGWVGIGFSKDGLMLNSSAMVGWVTRDGRHRIRQYHAEGFTPAEVKPDKGHLPLTGAEPAVLRQGANIHLAFQMKFSSPVTKQPILLAVGVRTPEKRRLSHHIDKTALNFDFSSGTSEYTLTTSKLARDKTAHGVLGVLGWGLLLPCGAIIARYLKHRDPLWFYLHVTMQLVGFLLALAGVILGNLIYRRLHSQASPHKNFGIFIFVLCILQVLALFLRPDKDSKNRRYWNWYHHWVGRLALLFGSINVAVGIHFGHAGSSWSIGYGFLIGVVLVVCIVLEAISRLRRSAERPPPPQAFQMN